MATGLTPLRARPYALESDAPDVAADSHQYALAIETVHNTTEGTTLPVSGMVYGDELQLTTTGAWYKYSGAAWYPMLVAGPWIALGLSGGVTAVTAVVPSARVEGDTIKFKGGLTGGSNASTWATLPTGITAPSSTLYEPVTDPGRTTGTCATYALEITSAGALIVQGSSSGSEISLDGRNYSLT